jgi:glycosyltransferase involved in cell wall biosynthesis
VLVGGGPQAAELERAYPDALFTGPRQGEALAEAYASADVFVFPSRTDTFGNAVLEAMSSGLPVVASAEGGPAEQLRDGVDGWIVDGTSVEAWRAALARLAADPVGRRVAGRAARAAAELRGWEPFLDALFGPRAPVVAATRAI